MTDYRSKYLKYKNKYLKLKEIEKSIVFKNNMTGGGNQNNEPEVYLFKAEWCGHCKAFLPVWDELNKKYKSKYNFVTFDSDNNKSEMKKWNIQGFPTLMLKNSEGQVVEFRGSRDIETVSAFLDQFE